MDEGFDECLALGDATGGDDLGDGWSGTRRRLHLPAARTAPRPRRAGHPGRDKPAWYGLPLTYVPDELGGLPVQRFHEALLAEGLAEIDRPGSTCPLNLLPVFQDPIPVLPRYPHADRVAYRGGQFPVAEQVWRHTLKLPVWHRDEDLPLVDRYIEGIHKVIDNHEELLG